MKYRVMTEQDLEYVTGRNVEYYNNVEGRCWTFEKSYKRIHQVFAMEDSMCMVQTDDDGTITGYLMGYFKEFDDIRGYYLEEIVIFTGHQGKGYGTDFLKALQNVVRENNASIIELNSVNDDKHKSFYSKLGFYEAKNFVMMAKFPD